MRQPNYNVQLRRREGDQTPFWIDFVADNEADIVYTLTCPPNLFHVLDIRKVSYAIN